jgi:membrane protein required for colicin V production
MTPIDYLILAIVAVSATFGALRGFLREAISVASWIAAIWIGWRHSELVAPHLGGVLAQEPYNTWAARTLIVIAVLVAGALIGIVVNRLVRVSMFSSLDRFLGFLFGVLRGVLVLGLAVIVAIHLKLDGEPWWKHSKLVPYVEAIGDGVRAIAGDRAKSAGLI